LPALEATANKNCLSRQTVVQGRANRINHAHPDRIDFMMVAVVRHAFVYAARPAATAPAAYRASEIVLARASWPSLGERGWCRHALRPDSGAQRRPAPSSPPPIDAPLPFNAVVVRWGPLPPEDAETMVAIYLRSAPAGGDWTEWQEVAAKRRPDPARRRAADRRLYHAAHSGWPAREGAVPRPAVCRPDGTLPRLEQLEATFIDSTAGPHRGRAGCTTQALPQTGDSRSESGYPKPPSFRASSGVRIPAVTTAMAWRTRSVTHLLLHHTVSGGDIDSAVPRCAHLVLSHRHAGLGRYRLQLSGRQERPHLRGSSWGRRCHRHPRWGRECRQHGAEHDRRLYVDRAAGGDAQCRCQPLCLEGRSERH
jgi:hypothetical protein